MAFFDELGKKITDASQSTIQKTKDLADTAKFSSQISEEEKQIKATYTLMGEMYYTEVKDNPPESFIQYVDKIKESENKIEELKNRIDDMKGRGKCPHCGATIALDDLFCASCGNKIEKDESATNNTEESMSNICTKCGKPLAPGALFCIHCGNKNEAIETQEEVPIPTNTMINDEPSSDVTEE